MAAPPTPPAPPARRRPPLLRTGVVTGLMTGLVALAVLGVTLSACGGPDVLEGTVVTAGTGGKDDQPLGGGRLAVLDDSSLRDFLGAAGIDTPAQDELSYVTGRVRRDDVTRSGGALVAIDDKGEFTLTDRGPKTICLLLETPQVDLLAGCVTVDLPATGSLTLTSGKDDLTAKLAD